MRPDSTLLTAVRQPHARTLHTLLACSSHQAPLGSGGMQSCNCGECAQQQRPGLDCCPWLAGWLCASQASTSLVWHGTTGRQDAACLTRLKHGPLLLANRHADPWGPHHDADATWHGFQMACAEEQNKCPTVPTHTFHLKRDRPEGDLHCGAVGTRTVAQLRDECSARPGCVAFNLYSHGDVPHYCLKHVAAPLSDESGPGSWMTRPCQGIHVLSECVLSVRRGGGAEGRAGGLQAAWWSRACVL